MLPAARASEASSLSLMALPRARPARQTPAGTMTRLSASGTGRLLQASTAIGRLSLVPAFLALAKAIRLLQQLVASVKRPAISKLRRPLHPIVGRSVDSGATTRLRMALLKVSLLQPVTLEMQFSWVKARILVL